MNINISLHFFYGLFSSLLFRVMDTFIFSCISFERKKKMFWLFFALQIACGGCKKEALQILSLDPSLIGLLG
jgi:hypothetical protein